MLGIDKVPFKGSAYNNLGLPYLGSERVYLLTLTLTYLTQGTQSARWVGWVGGEYVALHCVVSMCRLPHAGDGMGFVGVGGVMRTRYCIAEYSVFLPGPGQS